MNEIKTGALVCKTPDSVNGFSYKPLVFITGIPDHFTDEDLKLHLDLSETGDLISPCHEVLFRADIHATSNEVQEEFEKLHEDSGSIPKIRFRQKSIPV